MNELQFQKLERKELKKVLRAKKRKAFKKGLRAERLEAQPLRSPKPIQKYRVDGEALYEVNADRVTPSNRPRIPLNQRKNV